MKFDKPREVEPGRPAADNCNLHGVRLLA
jgi:hypothetical protein